MTVSELIEILKNFPQDLEVYEEYEPLEKVELRIQKIDGDWQVMLR